MLQKVLLVVCFAFAALLIGCGDSSSSDSGGSGVFADTNVAGLSYSCGTQSGVTGAGGTFTCAAGSTVTFSVGGITICSAPAQAFMTPVSCAQALDPTASAATPSVVAIARFLLSISTTPSSSGVLTITAAELQAAANLSLDFSTVTDPELLAAVQTVTGDAGATLVDAVTAQNELASTVLGALAGSYSGSFSGSQAGTWSVVIEADGTVSGSASVTGGGTLPIAGNVIAGTQYNGTAGTATWTGTLDTSQSPIVFSGSWNDGADSGTFTGHN